MTLEQRQVLDFMIKFKQDFNRTACVPEKALHVLSYKLISDELEELHEAFSQDDPLAYADALGDLLYVVLGAANRAGVDLEHVFQEIHKSNMTKIWPDGTPNSVKYTPWGKYNKPSTYTPPNLQSLFDNKLIDLEHTNE